MSDLIKASSTYSQAKIMNSTKNSLSGKGRILKKEIELDESRSLSGSKAVSKRRELEKIESREQILDKKVAVANNMVQAFSVIKKCINCGIYDSNSEFEVDWEPSFLILASHGIGNCYLWEPISDNGFHTKITGYTQAADFIYYNCNNITLVEKLYPLIFLLRNAIELCLKRLFYASVDNGVPRHIFFSKRRSY